MESTIIYLDESGDLGWKFDQPYRQGGSSRHLTISSLCVPNEKKHHPKRLIKSLYQEFGWRKDIERKWVDMPMEERKRFGVLANELCEKHKDISLRSIIVKKENVQEHIRKDGNKLYNYMVKLSLLDFMAQFDVVTLIPDPRAIKIKSGNSMHDYLEMELWFNKKSSTKLNTNPIDSSLSLGLQFSDMLAGLVQSRYEDNQTSVMQAIQNKLIINRLYF